MRKAERVTDRDGITGQKAPGGESNTMSCRGGYIQAGRLPVYRRHHTVSFCRAN